MAARIPTLGSRSKSRKGGSVTIRPTGSRWRKRLEGIRDLYPVCVYCLAEGRVTATTTVDHIIALQLGGSSDDDNLIGCCSPCNQRKNLVELEWARMGASMRALDHAPALPGSLKWFVVTAKAALLSK